MTPYLNFNGNCEAAFDYYAKVLGCSIEGKFLFGNSPMAGEVPANWQNKIMHITLKVEDKVMHGSDSTPDRYQPMQGFSVAIQIKDPAEAERVFHALADKGTVTLPIQQTFWAKRFGMCVDQFGTPWMVNCEESKS